MTERPTSPAAEARFLFPPAPRPSLAVHGRKARFPVHRIYCVGQNYQAHAKEMGALRTGTKPLFFMKPADAVVESGSKIPYPPATGNLHHEVELVIALGKEGANLSLREAAEHIFGYAVGIDLTRRDLQHAAKEAGGPWDIAKGFDHSAPVSAIRPLAETGFLTQGDIRLAVNGVTRQQADISEMTWSAGEIICELSRLFTLRPGDLIFTGTPAGVGPISPGDRLVGTITGLGDIVVQIQG